MSKIPTLREIDHTRGSVSASILLISYGSYLCLKSSEAHTTVQKLRDSLGEHLCFAFRHFPIKQQHKRAFLVAKTAEAAGAQGKFWEMHDMLFSHQKALGDASLVKYASDVGLSISQFLEDIDSHALSERVQADIDIGLEDGVKETPTFFISVRYDGKEGLEAMVKQILGVVLDSGDTSISCD